MALVLRNPNATYVAQSSVATAKEEMMAADKTAVKPTIARIWRGRTTRARADEYATYLYEAGIKVLAQRALAVQLMRQDRADETEFVTISYWENVEAMSRYAGSDPRRIHHLERDAEFLIELPESVQVLEITAAKGVFGT
jgi:heme-degrading monooxygenase HmoA